MEFGRRANGWSERADRAAHGMAGRLDDTTGEASARLTAVVVATTRLLRIPTAMLLLAPIPFELATIVIGFSTGGFGGVVVGVVGLVMAAISGAFWGRRRRILAAVAEPDLLAREMQQLVNLTSKIDDTGGALREITGGDGWRVFGRLRGVWKGATLPARWLEQVGELPRARYFAPPKIGTTVTLTVAGLWLVPVSVVVALVTIVGALAGSL